MIGLNRGLVFDLAVPFGDVKQSAIGREGGHRGLLDYTEAKYFASRGRDPCGFESLGA
jgi:succinate-semialdehyde dehydrogenase/glutarate-semialdehyde dehydrogenase